MPLSKHSPQSLQDFLFTHTEVDVEVSFVLLLQRRRTVWPFPGVLIPAPHQNNGGIELGEQVGVGVPQEVQQLTMQAGDGLPGALRKDHHPGLLEVLLHQAPLDFAQDISLRQLKGRNIVLGQQLVHWGVTLLLELRVEPGVVVRGGGRLGGVIRRRSEQDHLRTTQRNGKLSHAQQALQVAVESAQAVLLGFPRQELHPLVLAKVRAVAVRLVVDHRVAQHLGLLVLPALSHRHHIAADLIEVVVCEAEPNVQDGPAEHDTLQEALIIGRVVQEVTVALSGEHNRLGVADASVNLDDRWVAAQLSGLRLLVRGTPIAAPGAPPNDVHVRRKLPLAEWAHRSAQPARRAVLASAQLQGVVRGEDGVEPGASHVVQAGGHHNGPGGFIVEQRHGLGGAFAQAVALLDNLVASGHLGQGFVDVLLQQALLHFPQGVLQQLCGQLEFGVVSGLHQVLDIFRHVAEVVGCLPVIPRAAPLRRGRFPGVDGASKGGVDGPHPEGLLVGTLLCHLH
eukprot:RCo034206